MPRTRRALARVDGHPWDEVFGTKKSVVLPSRLLPGQAVAKEARDTGLTAVPKYQAFSNTSGASRKRRRGCC
eukprot:2526272-Amphidinium_carterae.1